MVAQKPVRTSLSVFVAIAHLLRPPNNPIPGAIYADNNGTPGALIASSVFTKTLVPDAWNTVPIHTPVTANTYLRLATTPTPCRNANKPPIWIVEGPPPHDSTRNLSALGLQPTDRWGHSSAQSIYVLPPFSEKGRQMPFETAQRSEVCS